jgi:hypothetical protein
LQIAQRRRLPARELEGVRQLLGNGFADLAGANAALIAEIETLQPSGEAPVLAHLTRVAAAQSALMSPLTAPWSHCRWAKLA